MKVLADPITVNSRKVLAGLQFLEVEHELQTVSYLAGEHTQEPYITLNPNASLPAIQDGDFVLWESNAILQYAADKAGRPAQYPTELQARADVNRWLLWESSAWFPSCYVYLVENCVKQLTGDAPDEAALAAEADRFAKLAISASHSPPGYVVTPQPSPILPWRRPCIYTDGPSCPWQTALTWSAG